MSILELKLFGGLSIALDGVPLLELKSQKGQALLCYLAVTQKRFPRYFLAGFFWTDMPEANALMNLRKVLHRIKPVAPHLSIAREALALNLDMPHWLDVEEFRVAAAAPTDINHLQYAASLYQGDFLDGFSGSGSALFDQWILEERQRLRESALLCLQQLVRIFLDQRNYSAAIHHQRQFLAIEPWREEAHRELMRLLALSDQRSAALHQYEVCRRILMKEFGIEPDSATVQLQAQIRSGKLSG